MTSTISVVIPTRNRSQLAPNAIRSVLENSDANVRVVVSDNSTDRPEVKRLTEFCRSLGDARLRYVRPPEPLPMPQHWEWALQQALADEAVTHISYLTDRMAFKSETVSTLMRLVARYPASVISYVNDVVFDYSGPIRLHQASWTGRLFELKTADMLAECANASSWIFFSCLPRMLNCVVPREVSSDIAARFGNLFLSIAPDLCFGFRCLERLDSILYYDKALFAAYAHSRSIGTGYRTGILNQDHSDFVAALNGKKLNYAPVPEFTTGTNWAMHEYCLVKAVSQNSKFPEIDVKKYLDANAAEINLLENPQLKQEMELLIEKHRTQLADNGVKTASAKLHEPAQNVSSFSPSRLISREGRRGVWSPLQRRLGLETLGSNEKTPEFETAEAALSYNALHPRARSFGSSLVEDRIPARELPQDW